jgi:protein ImuB
MTRIGCLAAADATACSIQAHDILLEVALAHSPRVEDAGLGRVYLDVTGLSGLFGTEQQLARSLVEMSTARGLRARAGIAGSRLAARFACSVEAPASVVTPGTDGRFLSSAPIELLDVDAELSARLGRWGLRTVGELARLPAPQLFERLGADGVRLQRMASGDDPRPLRAWQRPIVLEASAELDWGIDSLDALTGIAARLAEQISERLTRRGLSADAFDWSCRLADHTRHQGSVEPAFPVNEQRDIAILLGTSLRAHPPRGAVEAVTVRARPVVVAPSQGSLLHATRPTPRRLATTIAHIATLVGPDNVGRPVLLDSHAADAVTLERVLNRPGDGAAAPSRTALVLRRYRPPVHASVTLAAGRPIELRSARLSGRIVASAGPWRSSGEWWVERRWLRDEWDIGLGDGTIGRLAQDGSGWSLEGIYD